MQEALRSVFPECVSSHGQNSVGMQHTKSRSQGKKNKTPSFKKKKPTQNTVI